MAGKKFIIWKNEFSVTNEKLDLQHKNLFGIINKLYNAILEKQQLYLIKSTLLELVEYSNTHFTEEERVMQKCNFPDYESHKKIHDEYKKKSQEFIKQYQRISGDLSLDVLYFLKGWWINHILGSDQKYKPFLVKLKYKDTT